MNFDENNFLDEFLQQNHMAHVNDALGVDLSESNTPVPMNIPGTQGEIGIHTDLKGRESRASSEILNLRNDDIAGSISSFKQNPIQSQDSSRQASISGNRLDASNFPTSFMDEYLAQPGLMQSNSNNVGQHVDAINLDVATSELFHGPMFGEQVIGSQQTDDGASNFTDDFVSSLGTSIHSDIMTPVSSYQPQQLNSFDSHSFSQLSSSLRSPSTSVRMGSHLSSSLRSNRGIQQPSSSSMASTPLDSTPSSSLTQEEKVRRRKEFHNAVERRRRELIKAKIKELGALAPPSLLNFDGDGKEVKPNKGTILKTTIEYMECLRQVLEIQEKKKEQLREKISKLESKRLIIKNAAVTNEPVIRAENYAGVPNQQIHDHPNVPESQSPERIIDSRAYPMLSSETLTVQADPTPLRDDLHQFLSGNLMEQEDNTKLMFHGKNDNTVDFLLDFDG